MAKIFLSGADVVNLVFESQDGIALKCLVNVLHWATSKSEGLRPCALPESMSSE